MDIGSTRCRDGKQATAGARVTGKSLAAPSEEKKMTGSTRQARTVKSKQEKVHEIRRTKCRLRGRSSINLQRTGNASKRTYACTSDGGCSVASGQDWEQKQCRIPNTLNECMAVL